MVQFHILFPSLILGENMKAPEYTIDKLFNLIKEYKIEFKGPYTYLSEEGQVYQILHDSLYAIDDIKRKYENKRL